MTARIRLDADRDRIPADQLRAVDVRSLLYESCGGNLAAATAIWQRIEQTCDAARRYEQEMGDG